MPLQLKIKSFVIFYGDGTFVNGATLEDWSNAPIENVQAVLFEYHDGPAEIFSARDLYCMYENQHGLRFESTARNVSVFADLCKPNDVKCGRTIDSNLYLKIIAKAQEIRDGS